MGATINILLLASTFTSEVKITNPSLEPEVLCLINMLKKMGVSIDIIDKQIIIKGNKKLKGTSHKIIYDRIEAGSYIYLAGAIQKSKVYIHNAPIDHLQTVIMVARKMGIIVYKKDNILVVEGNKGIKKINLLIGEYPFFPTDLQQIITVVLTKAKSSSTIEDPIFPNRILHLKELKKMNAFIYEQNQVIHIKPCILSPGIIYATDLRCAFALIVAGAITQGTTYIKNIDYLFRGYEEPIKKLRHIGVNVEIL
jgi:UDP-N-acetylglucosamine 1-carboxyvinyltransferase